MLARSRKVVLTAMHRVVLGQHVGHQFPHAVLGSVQGGVLEQQRTEAVSVDGVVQENGQIGGATVDGNVLGECDQPPPEAGHQRAATIFDARQTVHVGVCRVAATGEESHVRRALRRAVHQLVQSLAVSGQQWTDVGDATVA